MLKNAFLVGISSVFIMVNSVVLAQISEPKTNQEVPLANGRMIQTALRIIEEQPDSIEYWYEGKMYLASDRMHITSNGVFISHQNSHVCIPSFFSDENGVFILCRSEEAQQHYDNARDSLIEAVGHSMAAGATIEVPPVAVYEAYQAVEAWKDCAKEYNAGVEAERKEGK